MPRPAVFLVWWGMAEERDLTAKEQAFILAYIGPARFNATEAARQAGYAEKNIRYTAFKVKQKPTIAARIAEELKSRSLTADEVLAELRDVATAEWRDFLTIKTDPRTGDVVDVRMDLSNKVKSLELLGKAHGVFTDRVDISGTMTSRVELVGVDAGDV